jgi:hypothetical protein
LPKTPPLRKKEVNEKREVRWEVRKTSENTTQVIDTQQKNI